MKFFKRKVPMGVFLLAVCAFCIELGCYHAIKSNFNTAIDSRNHCVRILANCRANNAQYCFDFKEYIRKEVRRGYIIADTLKLKDIGVISDTLQGADNEVD